MGEIMVNMIGEALDGIQTDMQGAIDVANAKIKEAEVSKDALENTVTAATASLAIRSEEVTAKESALDRISQAVLDAKAKVAEAQSAQSNGDAELVMVEKNKKMVEEVLNEHVSALKGEGVWEIEKAKQHLDVLLPLTKQLACDESLVAALPTTCTKKPCDRGSFDVMVINQVEASLNSHVAQLTATLSNGAPASAERATKVVAMQKVLDEANDDHHRAVAELSAAQVAHGEAASALQVAEAASTAFIPEYTRLIEVREGKLFDMDNFQNYNKLCFATLRDQMAKKEEPSIEDTQIQDLAAAGV